MSPRSRPASISEPFTVQSADALKKLNNDHITLSNATFDESLHVKNRLNIGDYPVKRLDRNRIEMGDKDVDIDMNRATLFSQPTLLDSGSSAIKGNAFLDDITHINNDVLLEDDKKICFFNSNVENCLTMDDVQYMFMSSNYIDKSKALMTACISKDGLQNNLEKDTSTLNIPLDDKMYCVGKESTYDVLDEWVKTSVGVQNSYIIPENDEGPSNICSKNDVNVFTKFKYFDTEYDTKEDTENAVSANICADVYNSCGNQGYYESIIKHENKRISDCSFEDVTTNAAWILSRPCPNTQYCNVNCKGSNRKFFNNICYSKVEWNDSTYNGYLNKQIQIKLTGSNKYINDRRNNELDLLDTKKSFVLQYANGKFRFKAKQGNRYIYYDGGKFILSNSISYFDLFVNGKFLIQITDYHHANKWLEGSGENIRLSDNPITTFEFIRT